MSALAITRSIPGEAAELAALHASVALRLTKEHGKGN